MTTAKTQPKYPRHFDIPFVAVGYGSIRKRKGYFYFMAFSKAIRLKVHEKYNGRCAYCGCDLHYNKMQVDHIRPQRNFYLGEKDKIPNYDVHDIQNLNPSCARCNKRKDTFSIEQFRIEIAAQLERLPKYNANYRLAMDYGLITETQKPVKFYFETIEN